MKSVCFCIANNTGKPIGFHQEPECFPSGELPPNRLLWIHGEYHTTPITIDICEENEGSFLLIFPGDGEILTLEIKPPDGQTNYMPTEE
jgi:hypothetical protein